MEQYLKLLENIVDNGIEKESGRANIPNTIGISFGTIQMDLKDGFPLLTTKKMYWKGIVHELLWFLRGETNIKYLIDNRVNIWNGDAYRWYLKYCNDNKILIYFPKIEDFVEFIKDTYIRVYFNSQNEIEYELRGSNPELLSHLNDLIGCGYIMGDLGKVYGYQWRNQNGVDQIKKIVDGLKSNPYSRYHVLNAWNAADFNEMALPPCHLMYQFIVRPIDYMERTDLSWQMGLEKEYKKLAPKKEEEWALWMDEHNVPKFYLDLNMYQRSCDSTLGVPTNIASMSLLLMIFAKVSNMIAGVATWIGGDTHIYIPHIPMVKEQLKIMPFSLPEIKINKEINSLEDILNLGLNDFELINYKSHPSIKYELFVGLKK